MNNKLYVGSLAWSTTEDGLKAAFEEFGEIEEVKIITDWESGRSRGFGFITFQNAEDAEKALNAMNGKELDGRALRVNYAQKKERRGGGFGGGGGGYRGGGGGGGRGGQRGGGGFNRR